ncbi:MAG: hypothetical protein QXG39_06050 [Candidatus Aenigmatarchaeota archaeon]
MVKRRREVITEDYKLFIREIFEWIKTTGVERGFFKRDWKSDLISYIYEEMRAEGKEIKIESVRRNINRMVAYYYNTGAQARSGRVYLEYIKKLFLKFNEQVILTGGTPAKYFLSVEEARLYRGEITALLDLPDFTSKAITIYRLPSQ